jgi:hypothetical protein
MHPHLEQNGNKAHEADLDRRIDQLDRGQRIRDLNDHLRRTGRGGMVTMTNGVASLGLAAVNEVLKLIAGFDGFNPDNDPWQEHDCAGLEFEGHRILWKIDYYDRSRRLHSPDPADPKVTVRALTVMLAEVY